MPLHTSACHLIKIPNKIIGLNFCVAWVLSLSEVVPETVYKHKMKHPTKMNN